MLILQHVKATNNVPTRIIKIVLQSAKWLTDFEVKIWEVVSCSPHTGDAHISPECSKSMNNSNALVQVTKSVIL